MSWLLRGRDLVYGSYNNLPNILIIGSLLIGSISGIIPILILGLASAFLGLIVYGSQFIMRRIIGDKSDLLKWLSSAERCNLNKAGSYEILVSTWVSITFFALTYLFLNALAIFNETPTAGANDQLIANRSSYMISAMFALCIIAIILGVSRYMLGCETIAMTFVSLVLGGGVAYGMWNLADIRMVDVYQIKNNMTNLNNLQDGKPTPVLCVPS
jgi:hypothetical protein